MQKYIAKKKEARKKAYDAQPTINDVQFAIGDKVLLRKGLAKKLHNQFSGPWMVKEVNDPNLVIEIIKKHDTRKGPSHARIVHKDRCKKIAEKDAGRAAVARGRNKV
uniref:Reverse transcriptase domain-containing protein n=1 Tax=Caenorhabditis tropicalis TaxID=1561998 RepID=A0A1I7T8V6_9PELO